MNPAIPKKKCENKSVHYITDSTDMPWYKSIYNRNIVRLKWKWCVLESRKKIFIPPHINHVRKVHGAEIHLNVNRLCNAKDLIGMKKEYRSLTQHSKWVVFAFSCAVCSFILNEGSILCNGKICGRHPPPSACPCLGQKRSARGENAWFAATSSQMTAWWCDFESFLTSFSSSQMPPPAIGGVVEVSSFF